ncbi:7927_t:CDS:2 [Gigaspora margarita]|uniref:7927_t:CDS:1 n=1 Tax=Gigaspora margarita TaxID=4874 RepID=A0ABN7VG50_GIGMA|nr:7927_t:CDS:2 [Gigaspora margarita]
MSTSSKSDLSFDCVMKCIKSFQRMLMTPLKSSPKSENVVYATSETSEISYPACDECYEYHYNQHNPSFYCQPCNTKRFRLEFDKWSTGNNNLDRLIQKSHIKSKKVFELLEWIPYSSLKDITRIAQGGFSTVYSAVLVDGPMQRFDLSKRQWSRAGVSRVIFKEFHNSKDSSFQFLEEIQVYLRIGGNKPVTTRIYGISQEPKSKNYGIVMQYADLGTHDQGLVFDIFMGCRPQLPQEIPQCLKKLLSKCWNVNPNERPTMQQIHKKLDQWKHKIKDPSSKVYKEFKLANENWKRNSTTFKKLDLTIHEGAVYKSRILKFKSLPKPINANGVIVNKLSINKARLNGIIYF